MYTISFESQAMLIGWGTTADGDLSDTLQQLTVPIMSNQECKRSGYFRFQITNRMMCAGYLDGGRDSCQVSFDREICTTRGFGGRVLLAP